MHCRHLKYKSDTVQIQWRLGTLNYFQMYHNKKFDNFFLFNESLKCSGWFAQPANEL